ncbi:hypothetical protein FNV43_RR06550 [Rhamnella rubrinervis]|uniref:C2H2-type domain-containing protein n=1 Tax=Rhamnella rubrinervis TaxID=2594499 RepID=A0A8K0HD62_9ROSA|nr:hypothetical protein FNV43_RR06550 [Rhamnella rubrinervis]
MLNQLENKGVIKPVEPYLCRVCGRKFYTNEKLVNHFKQLHEREHMKRLNQIESARGSRRVKLVGKYSMKMEKYKNAARDILTPKVGYGLADEIKRAGFWVRTVSDKPQAADIALKNHMVDVSQDCSCGKCHRWDFERTADAGFSWKEIMLKKAKKEAVSVVGKWKDRDVWRDWSGHMTKRWKKRITAALGGRSTPTVMTLYHNGENECWWLMVVYSSEYATLSW